MSRPSRGVSCNGGERKRLDGSNMDHLTIVRGRSTERLGGAAGAGGGGGGGVMSVVDKNKLKGERLSNYTKECTIIGQPNSNDNQSDAMSDDHVLQEDSRSDVGMCSDSWRSLNMAGVCGGGNRGDMILADGGQTRALNGLRYPRRQLFGYRPGGMGGPLIHDYENVNSFANANGYSPASDSSPTNQNRSLIRVKNGISRMAMSETESMDNVAMNVVSC